MERYWCPSMSKTGEKCALYRNHDGKHKANHLSSQWTDKEDD